jgi:hypothetical protein
MAIVRCCGSRNMLRMSDKVPGAMVAPASPSSARVAINMPELLLKAAITEATANASAPIISSRRRPMRSPSVPMVINDPATRKP